MQKKLPALALLFLVSICGYAQGVGLGTTRPDTSAALDITATARGLLIPRMSITSINAIQKPAKGLLAFDTIANQLMVNVGTPTAPNWQPVASNTVAGNDNGWAITGNRGTGLAGFIGTTDSRSLHFRVNNRLIGAIDPAGANLFWGPQAGQTGTTGNHTIGIGPGALQTDSTTDDLVAVGDSALFNNDKGSDNTAIGSKALLANTVGSSNTASGSNSLFSNTTGAFNTATGSRSLASNITGQSNVADGEQALLVNETFGGNVAAGYQSLFNSSSGTGNTAIGQESLFLNLEGNSNTATGFRSLFSNTSGSFNTAFGNSALLFNNTGHDNTATGYSALLNSTTGQSNTAVGSRSLVHNTTGSSNIAIGFGALFELTGGAVNVAIGHEALLKATTSADNVAVGGLALSQAPSALFGNTAIGAGAGSQFDMSEDNTAVGAGAILFPFSIRNVCLGLFATNTFANDQVFLGGEDITSIGGAVNFSKLSDGRFKKNIREDVRGIAFIMKLRPVTYQVDMEALRQKLGSLRQRSALPSKRDALHSPITDQQLAAGRQVHSGFIAQEVEKAAQDLDYDFNGVDKPRQEGGLYALRYASFVVPLVKTMQEQQQIIADLSQGNRALEDQLERWKKKAADRKKLNADLLQRLERIEASLQTPH